MNKPAFVLQVVLTAFITAVTALPVLAQVVAVGRKFDISVDPIGPFDPYRGADPPAVAIDPGGEAMVVWRSPTTAGPDEIHSRILARYFADDGRPRGTIQPVDIDAAEQSSPDVTATGHGEFLVAWSRVDDSHYSFDGSEIFVRRLGRRSLPLADPLFVNRLTRFWQVEPAVSSAPGGDSFVVWVTGGFDEHGSPPQILGDRRLDLDGRPRGGELQVNNLGMSAATTFGSRPVSVTTNLAGESMVVWTSFRDTYAQRFDRYGVPNDIQRVIGYSRVQDRNPAVAADAEGNFVIVWSRPMDYTANNEIVALALDLNNVCGGIQILGTTRHSFNRAPTVVSDPFGDFVAAWHVHNQESAPSRIAVRELSASPGLTTTRLEPWLVRRMSRRSRTKTPRRPWTRRGFQSTRRYSPPASSRRPRVAEYCSASASRSKSTGSTLSAPRGAAREST